MQAQDIKTYIEKVNLMHFSQEHRLPLRTLARMRSGGAVPRQSTIDAIAKAIRKDQRKAERAAS